MARLSKEINIHLIAKKAGVSISSVSRVLNNRIEVTENIRQKVLKAAKEFNFSTPHSRDRRINIGVLVALSGPVIGTFARRVIDGILENSENENIDITVIIYNVKNSSKPILQLLRDRRCDGVILFSPALVIDQVYDIKSQGIPTMLINGNTVSKKMGFINCDTYTSSVEAMRYLYKCGHSNIGFLCDKLDDNLLGIQCLKAYCDKINEFHNDSSPRRWICRYQDDAANDQESGYLQAKILLKESPELTALFCTTDEQAFGALQACKELKKGVPEDISILGFGNQLLAQYTTPSLSSMHQLPEEMGRLALQYLAQLLISKIDILPIKKLAGQLIIRDSVKILY